MYLATVRSCPIRKFSAVLPRPQTYVSRGAFAGACSRSYSTINLATRYSLDRLLDALCHVQVLLNELLDNQDDPLRELTTGSHP